MPKIAKNNRAIMLAVTTALASTTLAACTTNSAPAADFSANKAQVALAKGNASEAISHAEQSVLASPRDAAYRAMLGAVYMDSGRFLSAAASFKDAMDLGDTSPRTALSYALAEIAVGQQGRALSTLNEHRGSIDASDLGLALSLAGQPQQGVHVLGNALRGGQNTAKVRQNLAYSYALTGNWRAARLMAAEDVPADQISDRIAEWAQSSAPEFHHARVAKLLNVPVVGDTGQPAMLALSNHNSVEQMADAAVADNAAPMAESTPAPLPALAAAPRTELPALALPAQPSAVPASIEKSAAQVQEFAQAFAAREPAKTSVPSVEAGGSRAVSEPVVQLAPTRTASAGFVSQAGKAESRGVVAGEHLIQLGSFSSQASAERAWGIYTKRYPQLKNYDRVITKARVRGKNYFRVSAGGFQRASAANMCSSVKTSKQGCISWAANSPLPGALDRGVRVAAR